MTTRAIVAAILAVSFAAATGAASAQSVGGAIRFFGNTDTTGVSGSQSADPLTGTTDSGSDYHASQYVLERDASLSGYRDPASADWVGARPGDVLSRDLRVADLPQYAGAPETFRQSAYSGSVTGTVGTNGASLVISNGFNGGVWSQDAFSRIETGGSASSYWSDTVTFGGGTGLGHAHVVILLDGFLGTGNDPASRNTASYDYTFQAAAFTPSLTGPYWSPSLFTISTVAGSRMTAGGAYANPDEWWNYDRCNGFITSVGGCAGEFHDVIEGDITFQYGQAITLGSHLTVSVSGEGMADLIDTASIFQITVPQGTTYAYRSGIAGNPLNIASVPEPGTYALLFAGLGLLGLARRRIRR